MILCFLPAVLVLRLRVRKRQKIQRGEILPRLIQIQAK